MNDGDKYSPRNDKDLREILRIFFILTVIWLPGSRFTKIISNSYRKNLLRVEMGKEISTMQ